MRNYTSPRFLYGGQEIKIQNKTKKTHPETKTMEFVLELLLLSAKDIKITGISKFQKIRHAKHSKNIN